MTLEELRRKSFYLLLLLDQIRFAHPQSELAQQAHELAGEIHRENHLRWQSSLMTEADYDTRRTAAVIGPAA